MVNTSPGEFSCGFEVFVVWISLFLREYKEGILEANTRTLIFLLIT